MTTGNSAAMTVSVAKMAPPDTEKSECEELDLKNKEEREKAVEGLKGSNPTTEVRQAIAMAEDAGMTFSSASISLKGGASGGMNGVLSGCSNGKAKECTTGSLVEGGSGDAKTGKESVLCPEADYKHSAGGSGAHAEAKIFNQLSEMAKASGGSLQGGRVVLNTDWRYKHSSGATCSSGMPCRPCYRMLCAATKCGIQIFLCDEKHEPQPLDPDGKCGQSSKDPDDDPYEQLDRRMGEDPKKGRLNFLSS